MSPEAIAKALRGHWGIENHLHRVRDVELGEDDLPVMGKNVSRVHGIFDDLATFIGDGMKRGFRYLMSEIRSDPMAIVEGWLALN